MPHAPTPPATPPQQVVVSLFILLPSPQAVAAAGIDPAGLGSAVAAAAAAAVAGSVSGSPPVSGNPQPALPTSPMSMSPLAGSRPEPIASSTTTTLAVHAELEVNQGVAGWDAPPAAGIEAAGGPWTPAQSAALGASVGGAEVIRADVTRVTTSPPVGGRRRHLLQFGGGKTHEGKPSGSGPGASPPAPAIGGDREVRWRVSLVVVPGREHDFGGGAAASCAVLAARFNASVASGALARALDASGLGAAVITVTTPPRVVVGVEVAVGGVAGAFPSAPDAGTAGGWLGMDEIGPESGWVDGGSGNDPSSGSPGGLDWTPPHGLGKRLEGAMALQGVPPAAARGVTVTVEKVFLAAAPQATAAPGTVAAPPPPAGLMDAAAAAIFGSGKGSGAAAAGVIAAGCVAACLGASAVARVARWLAAIGPIGRSRGSARRALRKGLDNLGGGVERTPWVSGNYLQMSEFDGGRGGAGGMDEETRGVFDLGGDDELADEDDGQLGLLAGPRGGVAAV